MQDGPSSSPSRCPARGAAGDEDYPDVPPRFADALDMLSLGNFVGTGRLLAWAGAAAVTEDRSGDEP